MQETWIGNAHVVLPDRVLDNSSVLLSGGRIAAVGEDMPKGAQRVDAEGGYIMAGFVDIHLHGGGGADFMDAEPEAVMESARPLRPWDDNHLSDHDDLCG